MSDPIVSAIICVRDGEAYLTEALDSIAAQRHPSLETIVIDDGSQDRSVAIAQVHPLQPRVITQGPQGLSAALNHALTLARGDILGFLDCDDIWPDGRLNAMLPVLNSNPDVEAVYGKIVNTDSELRPISTPLAVQLAGAMLVRRRDALRVGPFRTDIKHAAILDWVSRANAAGLRFHTLDLIVLLRRIHGDNMGLRERPEARDDLMRVLRDHLKRKR